MDSILTSVKKALGIAKDYTQFDQELILHINSVISVLTQIGIGPSSGFAIYDDSEEWGDFFGDDPKLSLIKSYVYLKTRILFDPPQSSIVMESMKQMASEYEWRLSVMSYDN